MLTKIWGAKIIDLILRYEYPSQRTHSNLLKFKRIEVYFSESQLKRNSLVCGSQGKNHLNNRVSLAILHSLTSSRTQERTEFKMTFLTLAASGTGHTQNRPQWNKEVLQDDTGNALHKRFPFLHLSRDEQRSCALQTDEIIFPIGLLVCLLCVCSSKA